MTTSLPPAGVPSSGNQKYIAVAVLLLLLVGGLWWWRTRTSDTPEVKLPTPPIPSHTVDPRRDDDVPPPIAIPTVTASSTKAVGPGGPASNGCEAKVCKGTAGDDLQSALALRGRQARKCYERELANDPKLTVRMTMSVRVGSNGQACSASVASSDNPSVSGCVANFFRNGGYPGAKGGCADVNVPLNFIPGK